MPSASARLHSSLVQRRLWRESQTETLCESHRHPGTVMCRTISACPHTQRPCGYGRCKSLHTNKAALGLMESNNILYTVCCADLFSGFTSCFTASRYVALRMAAGRPLKPELCTHGTCVVRFHLLAVRPMMCNTQIHHHNTSVPLDRRKCRLWYDLATSWSVSTDTVGSAKAGPAWSQRQAQNNNK
jgi:hypothetical protein